MSASFADLLSTSGYLSLLANISARDKSLAMGLDPATTGGDTGYQTGMIRFNSANKRWEKYNGSTWDELIVASTDAYAITVTGLRSGNLYGTVTNNGTISGGIIDVTTLKRGGFTVWDAGNLTGNASLANDAGYQTVAGGVASLLGQATSGATTGPSLGAALARFDLKANTTDGLSDGGTYHGVLSLQQGADASFGGTRQLAFTDNDNLWIRGSGGALTSFGAWKKVLDTGNASGTVVTLAGGQTMTGYLEIGASGTIMRTSAPSSTQAWFSTVAYSTGQGDNRSHLGYFNGTVYNNYLRGTGLTQIDTPLNLFNGNVGIGVSPDVISNFYGLTMLGASGSFIKLKSTTGSVVTQLSGDGGSGFGLLGTVSNHPMTMWANGAERMRLHASGNVSVGTTSDGGFKFDVAGSVRAQGTIFSTAAEAHRIISDNGFISWYEGSNTDRTAYIQANNEGDLVIMHDDAAGVISFGVASVVRWRINNTGTLFPNTDQTMTIGGASNRVASAYLDSVIGVSSTLNGAGAYINLSRNAAADPYGAISVTRGTASSYSYYGLTRQGQIGIGIGIDTSNRLWIGTASGGQDGTAVSTWMSLDGSGNMVVSNNITAGGTISAANLTFSGTGRDVGLKDVPPIVVSGATASRAARSSCYHTNNSITIPSGVFQPGDTFGILNVGGGTISIIPGDGTVTLRLAGTTITGTRTLQPWGMVTVHMRSATEGIIGGSGLS